MTASIIIIISVLILLAYLFDLSATKTKIPAVILLLILGFSAKLIANYFNIYISNLNEILPFLGTIGLILIVLEGSLELEVDSKKYGIILITALVAFLPLLILSFGLAFYLMHWHSISLKIALINVLPLAVISSAIAIPSARYLQKKDREFITYESSLSDIFGVILFNFITLNDNIGQQSLGKFSVDMLSILVISICATLILAYLLNSIKHHIKFIPMLVMVVLIYAIAKYFHLPALIFILFFGLCIGNIERFSHYQIMQKFNPSRFQVEVHKFREITAELAFLIRALFFILFGYLLNLSDILNSETIVFGAGISLSIFILRYIVLILFRVKPTPIVFIAPRGLITILLFLSIPLTQQIPQVNKAVIVQVIIFTALIMMLGLIFTRKTKNTDSIED